MKYLPLIRNALVVVALCVPVSMAVAAFNAETAEARSYQAKAVNKANNWAYNRYRSALYIQSECYAAGYGRAECRIDITKSASSCSVIVTVSGPRYRVHRIDSTC